ncbi:MAG: TlpA family protein disulfide reductase [Candidatus Nomurabacteria bacterium]|nr:MAG: TlpA family protein disulfide reductase [Candidatus Nomurabacteria bacterium]
MTSKTVYLTIMSTVLLLVAAVTYYVVYQNNHSINKVTQEIFAEPTAPEAEPYTDLEGNKSDLEQYLGRTMVVNSWASWSPFSKSDLETLAMLAEKYQQKDVVFLAINRKESKQQAQRFLNTILGNTNVQLVLDPRDHFYKSIGGYAMPETVIYDSRGNMVTHIHGSINQREVEAALDTLLEN